LTKQALLHSRWPCRRGRSVWRHKFGLDFAGEKRLNQNWFVDFRR
jgi:hypothetical protein